MTDHTDVIQELLKFAGAMASLVGAFAWWRKGSEDEDKVIVQAANELLDALSNADVVNKIEDATSLNIRDQMTLQQAEDWHRERELRSWGVTRN